MHEGHIDQAERYGREVTTMSEFSLPTMEQQVLDGMVADVCIAVLAANHEPDEYAVASPAYPRGLVHSGLALILPIGGSQPILSSTPRMADRGEP